MNHDQPSFDEDEARQFNFPGFIIDQMFGPGEQNHPGQHGGQHHHGGGHYPGYPPGNQFPGYPGGQYPEFPGGGGPSTGAPTTPPPSFTPTQQQFQTYAVDPGAIRGCLFRFTYIWLRRDAFWFFPTYVGRNSVAGFRWRRNRWAYFGIDLNQIQSFQCF